MRFSIVHRQAMTSQSSAPKTLLQQIGLLLTGSTRNPAARSDSRQQPQAIEVQVIPPFLPPPVFIDYAAEGDEPADLALTELIPAGLQAFNLPHCPTQASDLPVVASARPLAARSLTEQEMAAAELSELIPLDLSRLDRTFGQSVQPPSSAPLPDLANLKRTQKRACLSSSDETVHRLSA